MTYLIPESIGDLRALTERAVRPHGERRRLQRRAGQATMRGPDRRAGVDRRLAFREAFWAVGR